MTTSADALKGRHILIVKGEQCAADDLLAGLNESGATILGPAAEVGAALELIENGPAVDAAVVDGGVPREALVPLVEELTRRQIPLVFSTASGEPVDDDACHPPDTEQVLTTLALRIAQRDRSASEGGTPGRRSHLLQIMPPDVYALLTPHLKRVELKAREVLAEENCLIPGVWFPETAVISMVVAAEGARPIEVGMVGAEGMTDLVLHADTLSALRAYVLIPGTALRIDAEPFAAAMANASFGRFVLAYKEAVAIQFAYAALSHGTSTIDSRLARWILMLDDRLEGDSIPVVHNMIADLLAVRRSGVTTALHVLEGMGAIRSVRGMITVRDRSVLKRLAGPTYGAPEAEYARVMARVRRSPG